MLLQKYGKIFASNIDYHNIPNAIEWVLAKYPDTKFGAVMGSSMGVFAGFHTSGILNPAFFAVQSGIKNPLHV